MRKAILGLGILFGALIAALDAQAIIGKLGRGVGVPCLVACGEKGVINKNFIGDFTNQQITQTSIDKFEEASLRIVNLADKRLNDSVDAKLKQLEELLSKQVGAVDAALTTQRNNLISDLNKLSTEIVTSLDNTLRQGLAEGDALLETRFGNINTIAEKQLIFLKKVLHHVIIIGVIAFILGYIFIYFMKTDFRSEGQWRRALVRVSIVVFFSVLMAVTAFLTATALTNREQQALHAEYRALFDRRLTEFNFRYAQYYASQLQALDPSRSDYEAFTEKAYVLRTVFTRPSSYLTSDGIAELMSRIRRAQATLHKTTGRIDPDLATAMAFISWQRGNDRFSEYVAASLAAIAIQSTPKRDWILLPLARHFLSIYLQRPIREQHLVQLKFNLSEENKTLHDNETGQMIPGFRYRSLEELQKALGVLNQADVLDPNNPIGPYIFYGRRYDMLRRTVVSSYVSMVLAHARATAAADVDRPKWLKEREARATGIIEAFESFFNDIRSPFLDETPFRQRSLNGLFAFRLRAEQVNKLDAKATTIPAGDAKAGLHMRWVQELVKPALRPSTARVIELGVQIDVADTQTRLIAFEAHMVDYLKLVAEARTKNMGTGEVTKAIDKARQAAVAGTQLGLFTCASSSDGVCDLMGTQETSIANVLVQQFLDASISINIDGWSELAPLSVSDRLWSGL